MVDAAPVRHHERDDPADHPAEYVEALRLLHEGAYWEAHEALEPLWLDATGDDERFFQAIILVAAALHHVVHTGRLHGAQHVLEEAQARLRDLPPRVHGLDVHDLRARLSALQARLVEASERPSTSDATALVALVLPLWPDAPEVAI